MKENFEINMKNALDKGWKVGKFKYYLKVKNGKEVTNSIEDDNSGSINVYGSGGIFKKTNEYLYSGCSVLFGRKGTIGKPIYVNERFWTVDTMYYTIFFDNLIPKWAYYIFTVFPWEAYTTKTALPSIVGTDIENAKWAIPKIYEQKLLVNYLDQKTTEIDNLITDKEKLIGLLKEKRQAIIKETVTEGLNLNVKMKDPGIDWIREIPEDWTLKKIKYAMDMRSGKTIKETDFDDEGAYPIYGGNGIRGHSNLFSHSGNYILIGRQGALCGNITFAKGRFLVSEHAIVVYPYESQAVKYYRFLLEAMNLGQYSVSAAQPGLSVTKILNLRLPVPSLNEMIEIGNHLEGIESSFAQLIVENEDIINKLKEYRQSIIYEAVTGKVNLQEIMKEAEQEEVPSS